jgi:hypothetical protein
MEHRHVDRARRVVDCLDERLMASARRCHQKLELGIHEWLECGTGERRPRDQWRCPRTVPTRAERDQQHGNPECDREVTDQPANGPHAVDP